MALHIGGLSSGNDYASMIEQLMAARRVPIEIKESKRIELDYDLGAWTQVQSATSALNAVLDKLRGFDLWRSMAVSSADEDVATAIAATASTDQQYTIVISNLATAQSISSDQIDTSTDLISAGYAVEGDVFEIEGQQITIEAGETLSSLRGKINSAALSMAEDVRVQASIVGDHLVLTREKTGAASITLSDVTGTTLQGLGILDGTAAIKNENIVGLDAQFSVNGISMTRSSNDKLDDVVEGLTINLKGEGTTVLDVHSDRDTVKATIMEFVEKYNALAEMVNGYGSIELSESSQLAQKGELYGDSLLGSMRTGLRKQATALKSPVLNDENAAYTYKGNTGIMDSLSDIGIWTSGKENKLEVVDASRLNDMLEYEFENVEQLFKGVYDEATVSYRNGIASDFYSYTSRLGESMTGDIALHIEHMTEKYDRLSTEIQDLESALGDYEQQLWDQFTRMEDALSVMEAQMNYIKALYSPTQK